MARYRAKNLLLLGSQLVTVGEEFDSDLPPGRNWEPLDAAAKAAVAKAALQPMPPLPGEHRTPRVDIPANWRELRTSEQIALARKLGAPVKGTTAAAAVEFIEKELAGRAPVAA